MTERPTSYVNIGRLTLLVSLGLHGLLLCIPISEPDQAPPVADPERLQVVSLPPVAEQPVPAPEIPTAPEGARAAEPMPRPASPATRADYLLAVPAEPAAEPAAQPPVISRDEPSPPADSDGPAPAAPADADIDADTDADSPTMPPPENTSEDEPSLDERLANLDSYNDFQPPTDAQGATAALVEWVSANPQEFPEPLRDLKPILPVPLSTCLAQQPAENISVVVSVTPEGDLATEPTLLGTTGYSILDKKALQIARETDYPTPSRAKAYSMEIKVENSACPRNLRS